MDTDEVSAGIEQLVDHLRTNRSTAVTLGDIAGVTEVLLATMRRYFNSIDTTLYSEFRGLSEYIQRARGEIAELRPNDLKEEKIPRAGLELEAIVASTEEATGTIMDAAEEIMFADPASDDYGDAVNDACMRIFEACSFQDITGQRITKVVATLTYIEERLHGLQDAWGPDIEDAAGEADEPGKDKDARPDKDLLHGPALDGEGIQQDQVDNLLSGDVTSGESAEIIEIEAEPEAAEVAEITDAEAPELEADADAAPVMEAAARFLNGGDEANDADDGAGNDAAPSEDANQDDIDAMFNGDAADDDGAGAAPSEDVNQDDIDAMFNGDAADDEVEIEPEPEAIPELEAEAEEEIVPDPSDGQPELDDIVPLMPDAAETASQDDIDALFD
ncbi:MAG: protein phosphatase CheZ [Alphaproteobacteria bacterium]|jgi:chemotaxis protein CheZ|nr:protein phosphatase CheZ [Alphaproteobacteria bacterium]